MARSSISFFVLLHFYIKIHNDVWNVTNVEGCLALVDVMQLNTILINFKN